MNKYFMHRIKHNSTTDQWDKGIEVKDTLDDARQSYHAYLGAYAYGHDVKHGLCSSGSDGHGRQPAAV